MNITTVKYIGLILVVSFGIWFTYEKGYDAGEASQAIKCQSAIDDIKQSQKNALDAAEKQYEQKISNAVSSERKYWKEHQKTEVKYETIEKEVVRYIKRDNASNCRVDDNFMRIWNAANANDSKAEPDPD